MISIWYSKAAPLLGVITVVATATTAAAGGPTRTAKLDVARAALGALDVEEVPVHAGAAERLAELRADTGLKLPDCCVLLAAQQVNADAVLTFDDRLSKRAQELGYGWDSGKFVP
jgi:predicted nucleic acid-binding protein